MNEKNLAKLREEREELVSKAGTIEYILREARVEAAKDPVFRTKNGYVLERLLSSPLNRSVAAKGVVASLNKAKDTNPYASKFKNVYAASKVAYEKYLNNGKKGGDEVYDMGLNAILGIDPGEIKQYISRQIGLDGAGFEQLINNESQSIINSGVKKSMGDISYKDVPKIARFLEKEKDVPIQKINDRILSIDDAMKLLTVYAQHGGEAKAWENIVDAPYIKKHSLKSIGHISNYKFN